MQRKHKPSATKHQYEHLLRAASSNSVFHGLVIPWGNAVDGDDTLWAFNFGNSPMQEDDQDNTNTGIVRFCGTGNCPGSLSLGDPISPFTGYTSDALDRITGGNIDPSGNVWLVNNWKKNGPTIATYNTNPGGNSFVIVPGAAAPLKTPLIGPPQSFNKSSHLANKWFGWPFLFGHQ